MRILLIDDEMIVREALARVLALQGHAVIQAAGGPDWLVRLEAGEQVDLALTDLAMPGMTGLEVARVIKAQWGELPVGLITGWGEEVTEHQRSRVDFVIAKPFRQEALQDAIARVQGS
ncbi:MAG: response regulator [Candidatus Methylomirabilia bacterium]